MLKDIQNLIKSHIPEAQADAMKEFIEEYKQIKEELKLLKKDEKIKDDLIDRLTKEKNELLDQKETNDKREENLAIRYEEINQMNDELIDKQVKFEVMCLQSELEKYKLADEKIERFFMQVFKAPSTRRTVANTYFKDHNNTCDSY